MRVSLVGHFAKPFDEGVRNVGKYMARALEKRGIETMSFTISSVLSYRELGDFHPDVIHFVLTPTLAGLMAVKAISTYFHRARTIVSAVHPAIPNWRILCLLKTKVLVQSNKSNRLFKSIGFETEFLPNGVDIRKFKPLMNKIELRDKFDIPLDRFVILHLASIKKNRNLDVLKRIQKDDRNQVLIIGRVNEKVDRRRIIELRKAGCMVVIKHFPRIEEIYNLSDCYLFPTLNEKACIEMPLSVLEAMSCNLPVITTRFGALPEVFDGTDGLFFVEDDNDIYQSIQNIKKGSAEIRTRDKVLTYSWDTIAEKLEEIYTGLIQ